MPHCLELLKKEIDFMFYFGPYLPIALQIESKLPRSIFNYLIPN